MTRVLAALLLSLLAVALPGLADAQTTVVPCFGPTANNIICTYTSATNTSDGSPGTGSAQTIANVSVPTSYMQGMPAYLRVEGKLTSATGGTRQWTVTTSWAGNSLTLFSALTLVANLVDTPFWVDCILSPASATAPLSKALECEAGYVSVDSSSSGSTIVRSRRRTTFTLTTNQNTITVLSTLTATAGLGVVVDRVTMTRGTN